jgi:hypothetical protein
MFLFISQPTHLQRGARVQNWSRTSTCSIATPMVITCNLPSPRCVPPPQTATSTHQIITEMAAAGGGTRDATYLGPLAQVSFFFFISLSLIVFFRIFSCSTAGAFWQSSRSNLLWARMEITWYPTCTRGGEMTKIKLFYNTNRNQLPFITANASGQTYRRSKSLIEKANKADSVCADTEKG